jgi:hypothetical protein
LVRKVIPEAQVNQVFPERKAYPDRKVTREIAVSLARLDCQEPPVDPVYPAPRASPDTRVNPVCPFVDHLVPTDSPARTAKQEQRVILDQKETEAS